MKSSWGGSDHEDTAHQRPPATGAAAAALGAYLRDLQLVPLPATVTIHQGEDLGRPGQLIVDIRADRAEIEVTGTAVAIT